MARLTLQQEQDLVERHKPLLVLYPEISTPRRDVRPNWRRDKLPPLYEDYHPRDVRLIVDHAASPSGWLGRRTVHEHEGDRLMDEMGRNAHDRIDILEGFGHSDRECFWSEYHAIVHGRSRHEGDEPYERRAYAHVVYGDHVAKREADGSESRPFAGLIAIEYWTAYIYNDWRSTHEGDWEVIVVFIREGGDGLEPFACAYSAHHGGFRLAWPQVEKANDAGERADVGSHPIVYVANGSHANYFFGPAAYATNTEAFGVRIRSGEFPFTGQFIDFTASYDDGARHFPKVELIPEPISGAWSGDLRWLNYKGEWGALPVPKVLGRVLRLVPKAIRFEVLGRVWGAPASLPVRDTWSDPFSWIDEECEEAPRPESWLLHLRDRSS